MKTSYPLSSDQLELLLAFEESNGLSELAQSLGRDPSVISRQLQRLTEDYPVLIKEKGKWTLSDLGKKVNELTRSHIFTLNKILTPQLEERVSAKNCVLLIINAQQGIHNIKNNRSNLKAEENIKLLLNNWRNNSRDIIHIKHISDAENSLFYRNSSSSHFMSGFEPNAKELVLEKNKSSAFVETKLQDHLETIASPTLILAGFTANECIEATARDAKELGYNTIVIGDATAMFDLTGQDQKLYKAEKVHNLVLTNINVHYARVESTAFALEISR